MAVKVAFQGERGAYSEAAALRFFGSEIEVMPYKTLLEVFEAVQKRRVNYGIVPIENSIEGGVNETYDLLLEYSLMVSGEVNLRISHCLISHLNVEIGEIKSVYSHPQALAQCRRFLQTLGCEPVPTYDTAGSVRIIKEKRLGDAAAIASERAAEIYDMKIIRSGIEDNPNNYTRFFALSDRDSPPTGKDKTSIIFSTKHIPGALYKALGELAVRDINLTKIESRPTKKTPWEYNFFVDFEGHRSEERIQEGIKGLEEKTLFVKILGSYPKAPIE